MQRIIANLGRAAPPAFVAGATTTTAHCRAPPAHAQNGAGSSSPTKLGIEEHEGFMHVGFETPVQKQEVLGALTDLSALGGVVARRPPTSVAAPSAVPLIEEIESESDASSDGSDANRMMASVEGYDPFVGERGVEGASAMDLLASTVTNVLNNEDVVREISRHLAADPAFAALMDRVHPGLPARSHVLLLEEWASEASSVADDSDLAERGHGGSNPLVDLLQGIQRGVVVAAVRMGEAFCHLGNFLRGLGEHLRVALAGMEAGSALAGGVNLDGGPQPSSAGQNFEKAVLKVAIAVAVMVFTRRLALPRVAL